MNHNHSSSNLEIMRESCLNPNETQYPKILNVSTLTIWLLQLQKIGEGIPKQEKEHNHLKFFPLSSIDLVNQDLAEENR